MTDEERKKIISLQEQQKTKLIRLINDETQYKIKRESFIENGEEHVKIRYVKEKGKRMKMNPKMYLKKRKTDEMFDMNE